MVWWHHWLNGDESESILGDSEGREALRAAVHGVTKSQTWLSEWTTKNKNNTNPRWSENSKIKTNKKIIVTTEYQYHWDWIPLALPPASTFVNMITRSAIQLHMMAPSQRSPLHTSLTLCKRLVKPRLQACTLAVKETGDEFSWECGTYNMKKLSKCRKDI